MSLKDYLNSSVENLYKEDYLGLAAKAGHKAKEAMKGKKYGMAWGYLHEQKNYYIQHARRERFTAQQILALDASVHETLADILRIEGHHKQALTNIVYWVIASSHRPIKRHDQKLKSYFNRCKFNKSSLADLKYLICKSTPLSDFRIAEEIVVSLEYE